MLRSLWPGDFTPRIGSFAMNGIGTATFGALLLWLLLGRGRPVRGGAAPRPWSADSWRSVRRSVVETGRPGSSCL